MDNNSSTTTKSATAKTQERARASSGGGNGKQSKGKRKAAGDEPEKAPPGKKRKGANKTAEQVGAVQATQQQMATAPSSQGWKGKQNFPVEFLFEFFRPCSFLAPKI